MLKNLKKIVVLALCIVILSQSTSALAISFSDVNKTDRYAWAYDYIMDLANKGIINGYEDGTFKPGQTVTYLEIIQLLMGVMNPTQQEKTEAVSKYATTMTNAGVPDWARPAVAIALNRGVATESELNAAKTAGLIETGTNKRVDRMTVSIYTARALELTPKSVAVLSYKDANTIDKNFVNLIAALIDTGVLHKDGRDGYFDGDKPILRSEISKMIKTAYDWVQANPLKKGVATTKTETGTMISYNPIGSNNFFVYKNSNGSTISTTVTTATKVTDRFGSTVALANIMNYENASLSITYKEVSGTKEATEIKFTTDGTKTTAGQTYVITSISTYTNTINVEYTQNGIKRTGSYTYDNYTTFRKGGYTVNVSSLAIGDTITKLELSGTKITTLEIGQSAATGQYRVTNVYTGYNPYVQLAPVNGGTSTTYYFASGYTVYRNGVLSSLSNISVNDTVNVQFNGTQISRIDVVGQSTAGQYRIDSISTWAGTFYATPVNGGTSTSYALESNAVIYKNGVVTNLSNVVVGDTVNLQLNYNNRVSRMDVVSNYNTAGYSFYGFDGSRISVKNNSTGNTETYVANTSVYYSGVSTYNLSNLKINDQINLTFSGGNVSRVDLAQASTPTGTRTPANYSLGDYYQGKYTTITLIDPLTARNLGTFQLDRVNLYSGNNYISSTQLAVTGTLQVAYNNNGTIAGLYFDSLYGQTTYRGNVVYVRESGSNISIEVSYYDGGQIRYKSLTAPYSSEYGVLRNGDAVTIYINSYGEITRIVR